MVKYYTERVDAFGHKHYLVVTYNSATGMITYPSDFFFD